MSAARRTKTLGRLGRLRALEDLRAGLAELDRLERQSHDLRGPRYGFGDAERASLRHAQLVGELAEVVELLRGGR